jgi:hypothetical protein
MFVDSSGVVVRRQLGVAQWREVMVRREGIYARGG